LTENPAIPRRFPRKSAGNLFILIIYRTGRAKDKTLELSRKDPGAGSGKGRQRVRPKTIGEEGVRSRRGLNP
jgi:hypothetical protein